MGSGAIVWAEADEPETEMLQRLWHLGETARSIIEEFARDVARNAIRRRTYVLKAELACRSLHGMRAPLLSLETNCTRSAAPVRLGAR